MIQSPDPCLWEQDVPHGDETDIKVGSALTDSFTTYISILST